MVGLTTILGLITIASSTPLHRRDNDTLITDIKTITSSPEINWHPCYEKNKYKCARLKVSEMESSVSDCIASNCGQVPLDYANPSAGSVDLAWIKLPVANASDDVLMNPGKHIRIVLPTHTNSAYRGTWWVWYPKSS